MGGKTATTTQSVQIPPEVLARYRAVNTRAEQVAEQPFQQYGGQFVAPITPTQQAGIGATYQAAGAAQPYYGAAAGFTAAGAAPVMPGELQTERYMSPYTQNVVEATRRGLEQQQGVQLAEQQAAAIRGGAFGGDRANIQRAVLQGQQGLATAQAIAPLYQQAFGQGLQTAQQQQGVGLQAEQANAQRALAAGAQFGQLGTGAQQAGLAGAQALMGAGTLEQQTQQADLTARYQQFLQERGYPFQVAQFLANIAMGTGALSGSTTTTTQPAPFFSDEREKTNIKPLGKGLYAYDYKDDIRRAREEGTPMPPKRVGPMAQDVEKVRPGLVVDVDDYKVIDPSRDSMGGAVTGPGHYAPGGLVSPEDMRSILAMQQQFLGPYVGPGGPYGGQPQGKPGYVPQASLPVPKLVTAGGVPQQPRSGLAEAAQTGSQIAELAKMGSAAYGKGKEWLSSGKPQETSGPRVINQSGATTAGLNAPRESADVSSGLSSAPVRVGELEDVTRNFAARGGLMPRGYAMGGMPYGGDPTLANVIEEGKDEIRKLPTPGAPPSAPKGLGSELMDAAKLGSSLYSMGSTAASAAAAVPEALTALMAFLPFSDARLKHNIDPVGETYDGQQIYRYDMGDGRTQLGLMAQEVAQRRPDAVGSRDGFLTLDYDRATEDAVPRASGGLVPRMGYQTGGAPNFDDLIITEAEKRNMPPALLRALIQQESGGRPTVVGMGGEIGLGQIKPSTARAPGYGVAPVDPRELKRPEVNIPFAADYLSKKAAHMGYKDLNDPENQRQALMLYNAGPQREKYAGEVIARMPGLAGAVTERAPTAKPAGLAGAPEMAASRVTPGLAGPGYVEDTPRTSPFKFFADRMLKGSDIGADTKSALTSENLWVPLLSGVGSMLASRSPYLGSAIGEGLVGGTKAYTDLAKAQQEMGLSRAETESKMAQLANTAFSEIGGILHVRVMDPRTGQYRMMSNAEWLSLPAGKRPPIDPRVPSDVLERWSKGPQVPGTTPAATSTTTPTVATPSTAKAPEIKSPEVVAAETGAPKTTPEPTKTTAQPAQLRGAIELDPKDADEAHKEARQIANLSSTARADLQKSDMFIPQAQVATTAQQAKMSALPLATSILALPEGQSLGTSGPFSEAISPYIATLQNLAEMATGKKGLVIDPKVLADQEEAKKLIARVQAETTTQSGQTAVEAMKRISEGIVNLSQSKTGQKQILANVLAQTQRLIDKDKFFSDWQKAGSTAPGGEEGGFREYARLSSIPASRKFDERYGRAFYDREEKNLVAMMNKTIDDPMDPKKSLSIFEIMAKYGPRLKPNDLARIKKDYGEGVTRYFGF